MNQRKGSDAWAKRTELAKACKGVIDILLSHYDPKIYEDMVLVASLDRGYIPLEHQRKILRSIEMPPGDGGSLRLDHRRKLVVKERSQDVQDASGMLSDFHDHIP